MRFRVSRLDNEAVTKDITQIGNALTKRLRARVIVEKSTEAKHLVLTVENPQEDTSFYLDKIQLYFGSSNDWEIRAESQAPPE